MIFLFHRHKLNRNLMIKMRKDVIKGLLITFIVVFLVMGVGLIIGYNILA